MASSVIRCVFPYVFDKFGITSDIFSLLSEKIAKRQCLERVWNLRLVNSVICIGGRCCARHEGMWLRRVVVSVLNLVTDWKWVVSFTLRPALLCGNISQYSWGPRAGLNNSEMCLVPTGNRTTIAPFFQPVAKSLFEVRSREMGWERQQCTTYRLLLARSVLQIWSMCCCFAINISYNGKGFVRV
jgi:hypothetical protein